MIEREQERIAIAEVVVKAWRDENRRSQLITDPIGALKEAGLALPAGCRVTVLEDTAAVSHLSIPSPESMAAGHKEEFLAELAALVPLPAGHELHLHQSTQNERFLVLPLPPRRWGELTDDEAGMVSAAGGNGGNGGAGALLGVDLTGGNGGNGGLGPLYPGGPCGRD